MNFIQVLFMIIENMFRNLNLKMKFFLIIIFIISVNKSNAETCKWWFQRYGWKNFSLNEVEDCLKIGSPVLADVKGGDSPLHIAAEVSNDPEILFMDEATSSLDGKTEDVIMESINHLSSQLTLFLVAHRVTTLRECDQIYFLENGKIIESGSYTYLLENSKSFKDLSNLGI